MNERVAANDILQDISKRYLTSEAVIKEFCSYALKLEQALAEVTNLQQVSEGVIADLRDRYTLSESVIEELKARYTLSEQTVASLKDSLNEQQAAVQVDAPNTVSEAAIADLEKRVQISEDIITGLTEKLKASEEKPKREPVPNAYFEGVAEKYSISISEAKTLFKSLGCKRSAFEFHLEERKKLVANHYGEYPYMIDKTPVSNVYESKSQPEKEEDKIARIVAHAY
jgi:uncharacterized coiled-coil protein SlyX